VINLVTIIQNVTENELFVCTGSSFYLSSVVVEFPPLLQFSVNWSARDLVNCIEVNIRFFSIFPNIYWCCE
jgi:hypothetical protein